MVMIFVEIVIFIPHTGVENYALKFMQLSFQPSASSESTVTGIIMLVAKRKVFSYSPLTLTLSHKWRGE